MEGVREWREGGSGGREGEGGREGVEGGREGVEGWREDKGIPMEGGKRAEEKEKRRKEGKRGE